MRSCGPGRPRRIAQLGAVAATCALVAGCTGTSRTTDDYRHKSANAAQAVDSDIHIALLDAQLVAQDKIFGPTLRVSLQQAYSDAGSTAQGFSAVLPPDRTQARVQSSVSSVLSSAVSVLRRMRVQAGLGRLGELPGFVPELRRIDVQLTGIEERA